MEIPGCRCRWSVIQPYSLRNRASGLKIIRRGPSFQVSIKSFFNNSSFFLHCNLSLKKSQSKLTHRESFFGVGYSCTKRFGRKSPDNPFTALAGRAMRNAETRRHRSIFQPAAYLYLTSTIYLVPKTIWTPLILYNSSLLLVGWRPSGR